MVDFFVISSLYLYHAFWRQLPLFYSRRRDEIKIRDSIVLLLIRRQDSDLIVMLNWLLELDAIVFMIDKIVQLDPVVHGVSVRVLGLRPVERNLTLLEQLSANIITVRRGFLVL